MPDAKATRAPRHEHLDGALCACVRLLGGMSRFREVRALWWAVEDDHLGAEAGRNVRAWYAATRRHGLSGARAAVHVEQAAGDVLAAARRPVALRAFLATLHTEPRGRALSLRARAARAMVEAARTRPWLGEVLTGGLLALLEIAVGAAEPVSDREWRGWPKRHDRWETALKRARKALKRARNGSDTSP